ncbi:MAG: methyltransferase domain-containing protein [Deltaproteobacteria bacterium]|nr:methyltransferase domain-containing protein [Candidatus Zymogenaceae bacterium]
MNGSADIKDQNAPGTLAEVLRIVNTFSPGRLLDAPAGEGVLAGVLFETFDVTAADIAPDFYKQNDVPFVRVDLNERLPFADGFFQHITCVEGIEHLENPFLCLREFFRIISVGGNLVITTPNIMTIKSRVRFFLYSYHDYFRFIRPAAEDAYRLTLPEYEHEHINPMTYHELRYALERAGFRVIGLYTNRRVRAKRLGVFYPVFKRIIITLTKKTFPADPYLVGDEILEGEILIIHAQKPGTPGE